MFKGLFFMVRTLALTIAVVLLMQFKLGEKTIEQEFYTWITNSVFVDYIQTSIDGGVKLTRAGYKKIHASVTSTLNRMSRRGKYNDDERGINFSVQRSKQSGYGEKENGEERSLPQSRSKPDRVY